MTEFSGNKNKKKKKQTKHFLVIDIKASIWVIWGELKYL